MDLSEQDQYRVLFALGLPARTLDPTAMDFNSIVRDRMTGLNSYVIDKVTTLLDEIDTVKGKLKKSPGKANVKKIGDIELDTDKSLLLIQKELARLVKELSLLLDISNKSGVGNRMVNVIV